MTKYLLPVFAALGSCALFAQDHGHLNIGASGAKLTWDNGADFLPESGYVKTLTFTNAAKYAGFYQGNITLTALHSTDPFGSIDPDAPKPGALVWAEIVSVEGPAGGAFSFWENSSIAGNPTITIPSGTTNANFRFVVSEEALGAGTPGGDAYGHIHGRRFTLNRPGVYKVGFRAHDLSTNGENGGPIHTPSDVQYVQFQAGVNLTRVDVVPGSVTPGTMSTRVTIGALAGFSWQLQTTTNLPAANWQDVGAPVAGQDMLVEIDDGLPPAPRRFYRAVGAPIAP